MRLSLTKNEIRLLASEIYVRLQQKEKIYDAAVASRKAYFEAELKELRQLYRKLSGDKMKTGYLGKAKGDK